MRQTISSNVPVSFPTHRAQTAFSGRSESCSAKITEDGKIFVPLYSPLCQWVKPFKVRPLTKRQFFGGQRCPMISHLSAPCAAGALRNAILQGKSMAGKISTFSLRRSFRKTLNRISTQGSGTATQRNVTKGIGLPGVGEQSRNPIAHMGLHTPLIVKCANVQTKLKFAPLGAIIIRNILSRGRARVHVRADAIRPTETSCAIIYADGNAKCHKAQADRLGWGVSLLLSLLAQDFATLRKQGERREYRTVLPMVKMREIPVKAKGPSHSTNPDRMVGDTGLGPVTPTV